MKKALIPILCLVISTFWVFGCGGSNGDDNPLDSNGDDNGGGGTGSYTISGKVADSSGKGISGVHLGLMNEDVQQETTTDSNGNYSLKNIANGTYMLYVGLEEYTFSPEYHAISVSGSNVTGKNFTGTATGNGNGSTEDPVKNITVSDGLTPQISWSGGKINTMIIMMTGKTGSNFDWAITSDGADNNISSPVTYGQVPSGAVEISTETIALQEGKQYRITITQAAGEGSEIYYYYFDR